METNENTNDLFDASLEAAWDQIDSGEIYNLEGKSIGVSIMDLVEE